ncbi:type-IV secretion system protein TraC, partial [Sphingopyxis sp. BSNA05]|uniref:TraC family protein n=1 Tax=Sphingopyxis sp. BSNA05 TaxID=1236614 RepID=UPI0015673603
MTFSIPSARAKLLSGLFGDQKTADHAKPSIALDMLSDWLPYRVFDTGPRLYRNARSKGFILSAAPLIGADERTGEILGQFFPKACP